MGASGTDIRTIKTVISHPQALAQCAAYISTHLPAAKVIPSQSSVQSLELMELNQGPTAIIASKASLPINIRWSYF